jgi:predicted anti-sigma-YlaC factor YlaD
MSLSLPGALFCSSKCTNYAGDVACLLCYLLNHVARHSMAAVARWALLLVAIIIVVMIVLGVGTTKSWLWKSSA